MSKLEVIPGYEVLKRISEGTMKVGDQYRRLNPKYPISLFVVAERDNKEEIMPSTKSFIHDKFIVLKLNQNSLDETEKEAAVDNLNREAKEEALRLAAKRLTRKEMKEELYSSEDCPNAFGLMDFCGQSCRNCINSALNECTVTFLGE